jgi:hypothetical protein
MNETELEIEKVLRCYRRHERHRAYALDAAGNRMIIAIFRAALDARERDTQDVLPVFFAALEKLTDQYGANLLRPKPKEPRKMPTLWTDPLTEQPLPNPWSNGDAKGQRVLKANAPELAEYFEKSAADFFGFVKFLRDEEADRIEENRLESEYVEEIHPSNVFVDPKATETDRADFVTKFPARAKIYQREAQPVRAPLGKGAQRTQVHQIARDADLWPIVKLAEKHNADLEAEAERNAQAEREAAEAKLAELRHKIVNLPDGRTITVAK